MHRFPFYIIINIDEKLIRESFPKDLVIIKNKFLQLLQKAILHFKKYFKKTDKDKTNMQYNSN